LNIATCIIAIVRAPSGGPWRAASTAATPVSFQSSTASASATAGTSAVTTAINLQNAFIVAS